MGCSPTSALPATSHKIGTTSLASLVREEMVATSLTMDDVDEMRANALGRVQAVLDDCSVATLGALDAWKVRTPVGFSAEYDWLGELTTDEAKRLESRWLDDAMTIGPDEIATSAVGVLVPTYDLDASMAAWLHLTRLYDACTYLLAQRRLPGVGNRDRFTRTLGPSWSWDCITGNVGEISQLFAGKDNALAYVRSQQETDASALVQRVFTGRHGLPLYVLPFYAWLDEVTDAQELVWSSQAIDDDEWHAYDDERQRAESRLGELLPYDLTSELGDDLVAIWSEARYLATMVGLMPVDERIEVDEREHTIRLPRLIGLGGIAELLGVKPNTARQWKKRGRLPVPTCIVDGYTPVWSRRVIRTWLDDLQSLA